jgi:aspartate aminotransferase
MAESRADMASFFASAEWVDEDAAFSIIRCAKADKHPDAVMLSAGIYRDGNDQPWTLPVVTKVKERIHNDPSLGHDYLPIPGDPLFLKGARSVALGTKYCLDPRIASVQTVAGTGANHVGALLLARSAKPKQVWFSNPTWINHPLIWEKADKHIQHKEYPYWNANTNSFDFEAMISRLNNEAEAGDIIVLQACAHNPTGVDPTKEQWKAIAALCQRRKLFPFFDSA